MGLFHKEHSGECLPTGRMRRRRTGESSEARMSSFLRGGQVAARWSWGMKAGEDGGSSVRCSAAGDGSQPLSSIFSLSARWRVMHQGQARWSVVWIRAAGAYTRQGARRMRGRSGKDLEKERGTDGRRCQYDLLS